MSQRWRDRSAVLSQDSSITFILRNASPPAVNVTAEGKNGTTSSGKGTFASAFTIVPEEPAKRPLVPKSEWTPRIGLLDGYQSS
jgi:hypothetical protein